VEVASADVIAKKAPGEPADVEVTPVSVTTSPTEPKNDIMTFNVTITDTVVGEPKQEPSETSVAPVTVAGEPSVPVPASVTSTPPEAVPGSQPSTETVPKSPNPVVDPSPDVGKPEPELPSVPLRKDLRSEIEDTKTTPVPAAEALKEAPVRAEPKLEVKVADEPVVADAGRTEWVPSKAADVDEKRPKDPPVEIIDAKIEFKDAKVAEAGTEVAEEPLKPKAEAPEVAEEPAKEKDLRDQKVKKIPKPLEGSAAIPEHQRVPKSKPKPLITKKVPAPDNEPEKLEVLESPAEPEPTVSKAEAEGSGDAVEKLKGKIHDEQQAHEERKSQITKELSVHSAKLLDAKKSIEELLQHQE
jgi:hypothetical protein